MKLDLEQWRAYTCDLRTAQQSALLQLAVVAWTQDPPCTLPADPDFLAERSGAGAAWPKLAPQIIARFDYVLDERYTWPWLKALFDEQMANYQTRQRASGDQPRSSGRFDHRNGDRNADRSTDRNATGPPTAMRSALPSAVRSALPSAMRTAAPSQILELKALEKESLQTLSLVHENGESAQARARDETARPLAALEPSPAQLAATYGPSVAANAATPTVESDERRELDGAYYRQLVKHADRWIAEHPEQAAAIETKLRTDLGVPQGKETRWLRDVMLEAVRVHEHWPDNDTWVERELTKRHPQPGGAVPNDDSFHAHDDA